MFIYLEANLPKICQRIASQKKQPRINFAMRERSSAEKICNMSEYF